MNSRTLRNDNIEIIFGKDPLDIVKIIDRKSNEIICKSARQRFLLRIPEEVSDPVLLSSAKWTGFDDNSFRFSCTDRNENYRVDIDMVLTESGVHFQADWQAPQPIWLVEWKIDHLQLNDIFIPALGGQHLRSNMPVGTELSYKYPFWWNAQFAIGESKNNKGMCLYSNDSRPNLKLLRVGKESSGFTLSYGYEAPAPLDSKQVKCDWYLKTYQNGWKNVVEEYREWMEPNFDLEPLKNKSDNPKWLNDINFILEVWGANRRSEEPFHTFQEIEQRLKDWEKIHSPDETLLYLPGFAENGIDSHAPDYNPSPQMGGSEGFHKMMHTAHKLGYKVMIHTNVLAMTFSHPAFKEFKKYQVEDPFGRPVSWGLDMDGDWITEPYFAYINPGQDKWSKLMADTLGELVTKYNIDGIFLDQTLLAFNVSNGPNFIDGMRSHVKKLQRNFPDILFAGEGLHECITQPFSLAQIHGIDSISNVHGMEGKQPWRDVHPISTYLFNRYTRFMAHLLTKHPSSQEFKRQESAYEKLEVIPALCLYNSCQEMDLPQTRAMVERAKTIKSWR